MKNSMLLTIIMCIAFMGVTFGQPPGRGGMSKDAKAKIEALRKGYINDKLELTDAEKGEFWPIYDEFRKKEKELAKKMRPKKVPFDQMDEAESKAFLDKHFQYEEERLALKKEFFEKLSGVIPANKLIRLHRAEKSFKAEVLKRVKNRREEMRDRKRERPGGPPPHNRN